MDNISDKKINISRALFDVRPVDDLGRIDFQKIYRVYPVINLAPVKEENFAQRSAVKESGDKFFFGVLNDDGVKDLGVIDYKITEGENVRKKPVRQHHKPDLCLAAFLPSISPQKEFEVILSQPFDIKKEVKNMGGKTVVKKETGKPRLRPIPGMWSTVFMPRPFDTGNNEEYQTVLAKINEKIAFNDDEMFLGEPRKIDPISLGMFQEAESVLASSEIESLTRHAKGGEQTAKNYERTAGFQLLNYCRSQIVDRLFRRNNFLAMAFVGCAALAFTSFGQYGISVKNEVVKESGLAVEKLEQAGENLKVFDFKTASSNFSEAYEEFSKAGNTLNFVGANFTSLFAELPGAGKLKSAKNLVEAGKLLAEAGKSMTEAVNSLSKTGVLLNPSVDANKSASVGVIMEDFKRSLLASEKNLSKASALVEDVDPGLLPEEKRESFSEFQSKLPELKNIVSDAVEYADFLEEFVGSRGIKQYLILFQNNSELRPTGGFPGTYAVVTFKDGRLVGFLVDDVYNLDGQLKENYIPPTPLQHITPTWGMRDANWFIDFSTSAQKVMEFFNKEAGYGVDGVITMSPRIISDILKVVGPIEMPEYGLVINSDNFLSTIQEEVEYGDNRKQPKKVVVDMAPKFVEKVYSSDSLQWLEIFNVFISGLDKKDMLMYFKNLNLENFVADKGFGGLIENSANDYLMVTLSNVKGSKTDRVTDNSIKVSARLEDGMVIHKLELTRQHNGGSNKYGFYNKQNPAYVRVLVPEGSKLISISGNSKPEFRPLINYDSSFKKDDDLSKLESGFYVDGENGVSTYRESGKTGFAFWLITDPGKKQTVELEYAVPMEYQKDGYSIYIQKQPGLDVDNFEFQVGDANIYSGEFDKDLELTLTPNKQLLH